MKKVKEELKHLKAEAEQAAGLLKNDDSIALLQKQIKWFQRQALVLDKILEQ